MSAESSATPSSEWHVEPWPEPVITAALLPELIDKISNHIVARPHEVLAVALWVMMSWLHEIAATHSAYLVATSAEPDSGKTTLLGVVGYLVPKPFTAVESTGPSIFRFVDHEKPTLLVDEADDLFQRKADVRHVFNAAWTRGTKIARQVSVQGVSMTVWFDPFCPKAVGLLGMNMPRTHPTRYHRRPPSWPITKRSLTVSKPRFSSLRRRSASERTNLLTTRGRARLTIPTSTMTTMPTTTASMTTTTTLTSWRKISLALASSSRRWLPKSRVNKASQEPRR
jgi:hypothetical protein